MTRGNADRAHSPHEQIGSVEKEHVRRRREAVEAVQFAMAVEDVRPQFERRNKADGSFELVLFVRLEAEPGFVVLERFTRPFKGGKFGAFDIQFDELERAFEDADVMKSVQRDVVAQALNRVVQRLERIHLSLRTDLGGKSAGVNA